VAHLPVIKILAHGAELVKWVEKRLQSFTLLEGTAHSRLPSVNPYLEPRAEAAIVERFVR